MPVALSNDQRQAIRALKNGSLLVGGVGSGKSRTGIAYYLFMACRGQVPVIYDDGSVHGEFAPMESPKDLYIITTAKKRDSKEWEMELADFWLLPDHDIGNAFYVKVTIDSWNNIQKYKDVYGGFFIFDEQRLVGSGVWVKTFLNLARKNQWILLTATPGDVWKDYIPVFVANGFYRNKSEFAAKHCVYSRFSTYPKIERYIYTEELERHRDAISVVLNDRRCTERHEINMHTVYDKDKYRMIFVDRWNPYDNEPISEAAEWCYLQRRVVNEDPSRLDCVKQIIDEHHKVIIFYNFNYELDLLIDYLESNDIYFTQWNGHKHEEIPSGECWAYLVQYSAGAEGWNCTTTDTIIFYSQTYSYRVTEQAAGRIDRMNTPFHDLYYYHLWSRSSIDLAIHSSLTRKKNFSASLYSRKKKFA